MSTDRKDAHSKLDLLALAKQLRNVSRACKELGFSRDSFYRFRELYESGGEESLKPISRRKPMLRNRVDLSIEAAIVALALEHPTWGQDRISEHLKMQGITVSPAGVRGVWQRHSLETTEKRARASQNDEGRKATSQLDSANVTEDQEVHRFETAIAPAADKHDASSVTIDSLYERPASGNHLPTAPVSKKRLQLFANMIAALIVAAYAGLFWLGVNALWNPSQYGDFGMTVDYDWRVKDVIATSPAAVVGLKTGDNVTPPTSLSDQLLLWGYMVPLPRQKIRLTIGRDGRYHTVALQARPFPPLSRLDISTSMAQGLVVITFVVVGWLLVMLRPGKMTWGFYLITPIISLIFMPPIGISPGINFPHMPAIWSLLTGVAINDLTGPLAITGMLMFAVRFPHDAPIGWRRSIDRSILYIFFGLAALGIGSEFQSFFQGTVTLWHAWNAVCVLAAILVIFILITTFLKSGEPERQRIKWAVLGVICFLMASVAIVLSQEGMLPNQIGTVAPLLFIVTPLTMAYAVFKHRVIDVRFVLSRAAVLLFIAVTIGAVLALLDWFFSRKVASSQAQTAVYAAIALLVGLSLNAARRRIASVVDRLFFRQWYRTELRAQGIRASIHRATTKTDLYPLLSIEVANTYSLASVALFERVADGGLVRVAAHGWPSGSLWHILPNDLLAKRAVQLRSIDIDALGWNEEALPAGVARPSMMVPVSRSKQVVAVLLCSAHMNGAGLDPDELRTIHSLCADAGLVYNAAPGLETLVPSPSA